MLTAIWIILALLIGMVVLGIAIFGNAGPSHAGGSGAAGSAVVANTNAQAHSHSAPGASVFSTTGAVLVQMGSQIGSHIVTLPRAALAAVSSDGGGYAARMHTFSLLLFWCTLWSALAWALGAQLSLTTGAFVPHGSFTLASSWGMLVCATASAFVAAKFGRALIELPLLSLPTAAAAGSIVLISAAVSDKSAASVMPLSEVRVDADVAAPAAASSIRSNGLAGLILSVRGARGDNRDDLNSTQGSDDVFERDEGGFEQRDLLNHDDINSTGGSTSSGGGRSGSFIPVANAAARASAELQLLDLDDDDQAEPTPFER
jgi:hypothetical protein